MELKGFFWYDDIDLYRPGWQFEEIFKQRIYAPYLQTKKDAVVLDIGANIGIMSLYASKYASKIYALEPSKEHFSLLSKMVEFNKLTNVIPINAGIGIKDGKMPFYHTPRNKTMYSLTPAPGFGEPIPSEEVDILTMETLFTKYNIDHVDLCKIDVEGVEQEILGGEAFRKVAPKIDVIVGESHDWSNRNPNQILQALQVNGFTVKAINNDATLFVGTK